jgi:hypothetical protein
MSAGTVMTAPASQPEPRVQLLRLAAGVIALAVVAGAWVGVNPVFMLAPIGCVLAFAASHRWLLQWRTLLSIIIAVIVFIPMQRYTLLPGALPFKLEPYRVVIAAIAIAWVLNLLLEPTTRIRRTGFDVPIVAFVLVAFLSDAANMTRVVHTLDVTMKSLTVLASFVVVTYLVSTTVERRRDLDRLIMLLVGGCAIVALEAIVESRTNVNLFNKLHQVFPPLTYNGPIAYTDDDGRGQRPYATAEHPISLSAMLVMVMPLGIYLALQTRSKLWWIATGMIGIGVFATLSRTGILMLLTLLITYTCIKPASIRRALPLMLPLLIAVNVAVPGSLHTLRSAFFPEGGLIAQQKGGAGTNGSGRVADLGPSLAEWSQTPLLGQGYGTRITDLDDGRHNADILDNQWLGTLLEVGALGFLALMWLFFRSVRRLSRFARRDTTPHGWLLAGLAASITSFGVGMFTYDAFSFEQVIFVFFIFLGMAAAAMRPEPIAS